MRGSASTAIRRARAVALNMASLMWWLLRPWWASDVQVEQPVGRHGLPKILDQFAVEVADLGRAERHLKDQEIAAAQVDGRW